MAKTNYMIRLEVRIRHGKTGGLDAKYSSGFCIFPGETRSQGRERFRELMRCMVDAFCENHLFDREEK